MWAGLARLTGGQVLYGMNNLIKIAKDPCALTVNITGVAKAIFEKMAWQHELYAEDKELLYSVCKVLDKEEQPQHSYEASWKKIAAGGAENISAGNKMLLKNEQFNTIQRYYDRIKQDPYSARYFWFTRFVMRNIHPYHQRFIFCQPFGDVTEFEFRWRWIEGRNGMWQTWAALSPNERARLVSLTNEQVIKHQW